MKIDDTFASETTLIDKYKTKTNTLEKKKSYIWI